MLVSYHNNICQIFFRWEFCEQREHYIYVYIDGSVQDYSNSIANAMDLLQCCTAKASLYITQYILFLI